MRNMWHLAVAVYLFVGVCAAARRANAVVANSLALNEVNLVSSGSFLDQTHIPPRNRSDATFGRVDGNGQNWMEFLVVQGDELGGGAFANTLDIRGWKIAWSY